MSRPLGVILAGGRATRMGGGDKLEMTIDGQPTSIGRLLLGPTRSVTTDQTDTMLRSETDGEFRKGMTASRIEGAVGPALVDHPA